MHKDHKCFTEITKTAVILDSHDMHNLTHKHYENEKESVKEVYWCSKCGLVIDEEMYNNAKKK